MKIFKFILSVFNYAMALVCYVAANYYAAQGVYELVILFAVSMILLGINAIYLTTEK